MATIYSVSVRARVAYALMCLEEAILRIATDPPRWLWILKRLWRYTTEMRLDRWHEEAVELTPRVVLECQGYAEEGFEYLTEEEFNELRTLYRTSDPILCRLIELVFEIGTLELYGGLQGGAKESFDNVGAVVMLMARHGLSVPDVDPLLNRTFTACNGWGEPFPPDGLSRFLMPEATQ